MTNLRRAFPRVLIAVAVFVATVAVSLPMWRKVNSGVVPKPSAAAVLHRSGSRESHAPSKVASADQILLSNLRALLRTGDVKAVQIELYRVACEQPFLALETIHQLASLENILDLSGPAAEAARRLPWADPHSAEALNQLDSILQSPWESYLQEQTGKRPPEEIYAEAQKAGVVDFRGQKDVYRYWVQTEALSDPEGFASLLGGAGSSDRVLWVEFFEALRKRPEFFPIVLDRIPKENRNSECMAAALQEWLEETPTMSLLTQATHYASLDEIRSREVDFLGRFYSDPAQRPEVLSLISQQPVYKRASLMDGMGSSVDRIDDLLPLLEQSPSISSQKKLIEDWLQAQESDNPSFRDDPSWLERLPSQKLRNAVKESLDP